MDQRNLASPFLALTTPRQQQQSLFDNFDAPFTPMNQHRQEVGQLDLLVRDFRQLHPFSRSTVPFSAANYSQSRQPNLLQYINPHSDKAPRVFEAHQRNFGKAEQSYKTVMCQNWLERAECHFGSKCRFAHGPEELRNPTIPLPINDKYKTRLCEKYNKNGICPYGERCLFIHPELPSQSGSSSTTFAQLQPPSQHRMPLIAVENKPEMALFPPPSMSSNRNAFAASLPSFSHIRQQYFNQSQFQQQQTDHQQQSRNMLPHIQEELRRERDEQQVSSGTTLSGHSLLLGTSSRAMLSEQQMTTERQLEDMVDKLTSTPSFSVKSGDAKKEEFEEYFDVTQKGYFTAYH